MSTYDDLIYVGQESLELRMDTNIDISGASSLKIKYKKPDGTTGSWEGTLYGTTYIKKAFLKDGGELDTSGNWIFWTWATMADGREIMGKPLQIYIKAEGTP